MSFSSTARRSSSAPIFSRSGRIGSTTIAPTACRSARSGCSRPRCCNSSRTARRASSRPISPSSSTSRRTRSAASSTRAYKSHRPEPPADLVPQFPLMRATVRAFGMVPVEQDRYEADDLIATYARQALRPGRRRSDRVGRQGPDAAHRAPRRHVRPGLRRPRGAAHRPGRGFRLFWRRAGQGGRRPGARWRFDRQRARRARHRGQDGGAAHRRIWRPRDAARARRRDQAAEAPRGADAARERQPHPASRRSWSRWCATCRSRRRSTTSPRRRSTARSSSPS